jgi:predicted transcriptional regulator
MNAESALPDKQKTAVIRARVTDQIKRQVDALAEASGESEAYILRQAIREYLERHSKK